MKTVRSLLPAALVLTLMGCTAQLNVPGLYGNPSSTSDTHVLVNNTYGASVVISAVNHGTIYRLGSVQTGATATFVLPKSAVLQGDLELRARPLGHHVDYSSGPILFTPGETIEFTIENLLELSTVNVY